MSAAESLVSPNVDADFPQELKGKRILLATESLGPINGVSRTTGMLIEYLRDNGVQVAVVAPVFSGQSKHTNTIPTRPGNDVELRVDGYPLPYNPDLTVAYPLQLRTLFRKAFKPDIIYLASPASVGFQLLLQIRQMGAPPPVLLNFQTDLSAYSEIIFPQPMSQYGVWLLAVVQGFLFSSKAVHTIFYPSKMVRDYLEKAGAPMAKTVHMGRGVDTQLFNPTCRDEDFRREVAPNGEIILCCVGRLAPEKGFGFLAEVAEALDALNVAFKLVITGGNQNPAVEEDVRRLFNKTKERVVFTGFRKGAALARVYASADMFLHCSITETFGLVVLEAMASGVPVIARDQGGPSEIVRDQQSGYLIQPDDLDGFVSATNKLIQDPELRRGMSEAAREIALDTTWKKINNGVAEQITRALIAGKAAEKNRPIRNWFVTGFKTLVVSVRMYLALGLIWIMWGVAVVPLLIHGNSVFPSDWFNTSWPSVQDFGDRLSESLKFLGP